MKERCHIVIAQKMNQVRAFLLLPDGSVHVCRGAGLPGINLGSVITCYWDSSDVVLRRKVTGAGRIEQLCLLPSTVRTTAASHYIMISRHRRTPEPDDELVNTQH